MEKKNRQKKGGLSRIFELAESHKALLAVSGVLAALASIASFLPYISIYWITRDLLAVYPDFTNLDRKVIFGYGLLAVGGIAADALCFFLSSVCAHFAAFGTQYELKTLFMRHLAKVPLGFHLNIGSGRFRKVIDQDIEKIEKFIAHTYPDMVASFTAPVLLLILLFVFDLRFGLAALAAVIAAFAVQMMTIGKAGPEVMAEIQKSEADMTQAAVEYVRGMPVLKAFGQTALSFRQLCGAIRSYSAIMLTYALKWENSLSAFMAIINNIYLFILAVGILIGRNSADYASFLPAFLFYLLFVPAIASVLHKFMYVSSSSLRIAGGVANFDAVMALPELPQVREPKTPQDFSLVFENVSFFYEGKKNPALSNLSFTVPQGSFTAIVGPSGGGKSTIAHLIPRFWDVSEGAIRIGSADIRSLSEEELMNTVSFVFQDVRLFHDSLRENIRMGLPEASDEEVRLAAQAAMCEEFILKLPQGYDTILGEKGVRLSGGEEQRLSIARAILRKAPILVLDEATAFADPENERLIKAALKELTQGKTVIMIAHRLGTVADADNILVMEEGKLAESGSHEELLAKKGVYAAMWARYTQSLSWGLNAEKEGIA